MFIIGAGLRRVVCPHCSWRFSLADCSVIARDSELLLWRPSAMERALGRVWLRPLTDSRFRDERAAWQCPGPGCLRALPSNVEYARTCRVGLLAPAGASTDGWHGALAELIEHRAALGRLGIGTVPVDEDRSRQRRPEAGRPHAPTVCTLLPPGDRGRPLNLTLLPVGPAEVPSPQTAAVSGLVFLFDPLSLPGVMERLTERERTGLPGSVEDSVRPLRAAAAELWRLHGRRQGDPIQTPVAVAVQRVRLLRRIGHALGVRSEFLSESGADLDPRAAGRVNHEIDQLLSRLGGEQVVDALRPFARRAYFAVPESRPSPGLDAAEESRVSLRWLHPVLWVLGEVDVLRLPPARTAPPGAA